MIGDPISDLIIRIKNASRVGKDFIEMPYSNFKMAVAQKLSDAGFVGRVDNKGTGTKRLLVIELLYKENGVPHITDVKRVSKPGRRLYKGVKDIFPFKYGSGIVIFSTPKGVLTDMEAREERVGGEELFKIW